MPKVSIIIPTFNRANFIGEAIKSVINQTFMDWELFIIDDGSADNTAEVVSRFLKDKRVKYSFKENEGVSSARNYGMKLALGTYVAFLDSDDRWSPEKLQYQIEFLDHNDDIDLVYTPVLVNGLTGISSKLFGNRMTNQKLKGKILVESLLKDSIIPPTSSIVFRYRKFRIYFDENTNGIEDFVFFVEMGLSGAVFYGLEKPSAILRRNHASLVSDRYLHFKKTLQLIDIMNTKKCNLPLDVNTAKALIYLRTAKNILRSFLINKQIGLFKKYIFYFDTLLKAFYCKPNNILLYKHIIKDFPRKFVKSLCIRKY